MNADRYLAVISQTRTGYSGGFLDLPGCVAAGKDREGTLTLLAEALALHLSVLRLDAEPVCPPTSTSVPDLAPGEEAIWIEAAPMNPVSDAVHELILDSGKSLRGLAAEIGIKPSVLHRLQDPFYWGHSLNSLRRLGDALGQDLHVEFHPRS